MSNIFFECVKCERGWRRQGYDRLRLHIVGTALTTIKIGINFGVYLYTLDVPVFIMDIYSEKPAIMLAGTLTMKYE